VDVTHALAGLAPQLLGIDWLEPDYLIEAFGTFALWGVALIVFAECGLLVGFFLPGDSLLFTVGLFIARDFMSQPLWLACIVLTVAAVAGNLTGYWIGRKAGPPIFSRPDSRIFKQEYVDQTFAFFDKYGNRAIVLARFVPIVRTFITVLAGVGKMDPRRFMIYTSIGGVLWATGVTVLGYFLGQIDFVHDNIEAMLVLIVLISFLPIIFEIWRTRRSGGGRDERYDEPEERERVIREDIAGD
jgi:membrane-associated protein